MKNSSLYLSQSYADAWDDYERSLSGSIPAWDYVILTASNEHQAEAFRLQIESRRSFLPRSTVFSAIPDEGGVRVGSGGATLSVLRYLHEEARGESSGWGGKRILVIHSGGDSKRVPQYSALGKLFSPVPHKLPDGRSSTLFDEFLIAMSAVPGRIREGMLLLSGDVLLLFNPLLIDYSGSGAAVISFKESVNTGKNHGVYLRGEDGNVRSFLHKQSVETLKAIGAVNASGDVDILAGVQIDTVRRRSFDGRDRGEDTYSADIDFVAFVEVEIPKSGIPEFYPFNSYVGTPVDANQAGAPDFQVGAIGVFPAPGPERIPGRAAVSVKRS